MNVISAKYIRVNIKYVFVLVYVFQIFRETLGYVSTSIFKLLNRLQSWCAKQTANYLLVKQVL